ncbi:hypothetical protein DPMN_040866 [Dreissena polymorpha]|uniref:Uncharacterized protein n=1 Tax=Dreissena polymorpha TaxID=45954 RepID=A0A9D4HXC1_DREPO|nr:hypothetical protein DPMN_040866 [Dreissena polymorpha]
MLVLCDTSCSKPQSTESAHHAVDVFLSSVSPLVQSSVHRECSPCCLPTCMASVLPLVQSPSPQRVLTLLLIYACPL